MRVMTWNVARRSSRLAEQAAALASRDPDVVALQEVTLRRFRSGGPCWSGSGFPTSAHRWMSPTPPAAPPSPRRTGVLLGPSAARRDPSATLPVPCAETALAALADAAIGPVEIHCLHVPNAANGWVKAHTLHRCSSAARSVRCSPRCG